jgi:hypothetical protein
MVLQELVDIGNKLKAIDLIQVSLEAVRENEGMLIEMNHAQLQNSIDREGEALGEYASIEYANKKGRIDVDLKLTGAFYRGWNVKADDFPILFDSTDSKTEDLKQKYGEEIFGTTKGNTERVAQEICLPRCQESIIKAVQL